VVAPTTVDEVPAAHGVQAAELVAPGVADHVPAGQEVHRPPETE